MIKINLIVLLWAFCGCVSKPVLVRNEFEHLNVTAYKVEIEPNFTEQSIEGTTELTVEFFAPTQSLSIPVNDLIIETVTSDVKDFQWKQVEKTLRLTFTEAPKKIVILYHGKPKKGLIWGSNFVYSAYFTCHWMICDEDPGKKAKFDFTLLTPKKFKATASGNLVSEKNYGFGKTQFNWKEDKPYSTYIFGFAAGEFSEAELTVKGKKIRLLGVNDNAQSLVKKFEDTKKALKFFEDKAGVPLQHSVYTQVLVPGSEAQENNAFTVIGHQELDPILENPHEDWSFVHELSHQWWGNLLTCKSWQHGWLNEGITTFMVAAYKEQRWGRENYQSEIELAKKRWQRSIDAGFDKPIAYAGTYPSLGIKRGIMYSKAAVFLDTLRTELGEKIFWSGLKKYTQKFAYQSVESKDFQSVMEEVSQKDLSALFNKWVY